MVVVMTALSHQSQKTTEKAKALAALEGNSLAFLRTGGG